MAEKKPTPRVAETAPKEADKTSYPVPNDAEIEDPPVRTGKPDTEISEVLGVGAGAHNPPDPKEFGPDGRPLTPDNE